MVEDHVTSGPMIVLEKLHPMAQTDRQTDRQTNRQTLGHGDSMTESAQWARFGENSGHLFM